HLGASQQHVQHHAERFSVLQQPTDQLADDEPDRLGHRGGRTKRGTTGIQRRRGPLTTHDVRTEVGETSQIHPTEPHRLTGTRGVQVAGVRHFTVGCSLQRVVLRQHGCVVLDELIVRGRIWTGGHTTSPGFVPPPRVGRVSAVSNSAAIPFSCWLCACSSCWYSTAACPTLSAVRRNMSCNRAIDRAVSSCGCRSFSGSPSCLHSKP